MVCEEMLKTLADNTNQNSLASRLRRRRFAFFRSLLDSLPRPVRVLDVGGTADYWRAMGVKDATDYEVTLFNLEHPGEAEGFVSLVGDARDMSQFARGAFDVVYSNSVIEHVGSLADQLRMAREIRRVGVRYFVQTPNRYFPIEPHFLFPCYQFLPDAVRARLLRSFRLGWMRREPDFLKAYLAVTSIRLLTKTELKLLFPDGQLYAERLFGLSKSFVTFRGWQTLPPPARVAENA